MERAKGIWYENMDKDRWTPEYPECSVFEQVRRNAQKYLDTPIFDFQNKQYSFREFIEIVERTATSLLVIGIKKGDVVSIISPNIPQGLFMFYAVNRMGAVANMIHPLLSTNEIQHFIENTESSAVLVVDAVYNKVAPIKWKTEKAPKVIIARVIDALPFYLKPLYALKAPKPAPLNPEHDNIYWNDFLKLADSSDITLPPDEGKPDDLAVILYSGGTTGIAKGVMLTNYNFTCYAIQVYEAGGIDENKMGKGCLAVLPIFHGFGLALFIHTMVCFGACLYLVPVFDFKKCTSLIFKKKIGIIGGIPALFESLSRDPRMETEDLSFMNVLLCGGDVVPEKMQKRINRQLKAGGSKTVLRQGYGLTECVTGCTVSPYFDNVIGSVGLPLPDTEMKVVEIGTCKEVPNGTDGELCISGPTLMRGYYKNEEATKEVLKTHDDGKVWLHTGDIFCKRDDGHLFFRQRISRMIISSGYNIYLSQIEDSLSGCDIVDRSCAVGIKDKVVGDKIGVYIILKNKMDEDEALEIIRTHCKENLAEYAQPHEIVFIDEFPKTKMEKIDFKLLEKKMNEYIR